MSGLGDLGLFFGAWAEDQAESARSQCSFGVFPQADNQPWLHYVKLMVQIRRAVFYPFGERLAVVGRVTVHHVGDEDLFFRDFRDVEALRRLIFRCLR